MATKDITRTPDTATLDPKLAEQDAVRGINADYKEKFGFSDPENYVYKAPKVGGGTMLRFNPLFMVQDRLARRLDTLEHNFGLNPRARGEVMARLTEQIALPLVPVEDSVPGPTPDPHHESAVGFLERLGNDPERLH